MGILRAHIPTHPYTIVLTDDRNSSLIDFSFGGRYPSKMFTENYSNPDKIQKTNLSLKKAIQTAKKVNQSSPYIFALFTNTRLFSYINSTLDFSEQEVTVSLIQDLTVEQIEPIEIAIKNRLNDSNRFMVINMDVISSIGTVSEKPTPEEISLLSDSDILEKIRFFIQRVSL